MAVTLSLSIAQNSQSVANNTSSVTVTVKCSWTSGSWNADSCPGTLTIDGTAYSFSSSFNTGQSSSGSQTLWTKTATIKHASNGTKTLTCKATFATGVSSGTISASAQKTLTTIPRKSTASISAQPLGQSSTITVTRKSSSFTHTLKYSCGSASGTIVTKSSNTSISWTAPLTLANQNTSGTSVSVTFTLTTYSGSTNIGSNTYTKSFSIPASVVPTASLAVDDANGYESTFGAYVQGKSALDIDITAAGDYGSTIKSYKTTVDGKTYTSNDITTEVLSGSGSMTITTVVTDTRGRTATVSETITVLPYYVPRITALTAYRCAGANDSTPSQNGAYIAVKFSSDLASLSNQNTAEYTLQYKKHSASGYTSVTLTTYDDNLNVTDGIYIFSADASSYDIILTAEDEIESVDRTATGPSLQKLFSIFRQGAGIAFGKIAELTNVFDVGWLAKLREGLSIGNNKYISAEDSNGDDTSLIGLDANDDMIVGFDLYDNATGDTKIYGDTIQLESNDKIYGNGIPIPQLRKIWENLSPTSSYAADDISIDIDADSLVIGLFKVATSGDSTVLGMGRVGDSMQVYHHGATAYRRPVSISTSQLGVSDCVSYNSYGSASTTTSNSYLIPLMFFEIKGVL